MKKSTMSRRERKNLIRILVSLAMFVTIFIADHLKDLGTLMPWGKLSWLFPFMLYLAVYILIGYDVLWKAIRNILHGQIFDENFLMCIATLGAFALGIYRGVSGMPIEGFDEACAVLLFYQVGEWFQVYATGKSRKSISKLMDIRPDYANLKTDDTLIVVDPAQVKVGDIVVVKAGERVPLDGVVIHGHTTLDTKALTGEAIPRDISEGEEILSGTVNLTTQIEVRVTKEFYASTVSKILDLVENASNLKSKAENFITKFAKYYTPTVVALATALAIVPSLITADWSTWIYRALSFLVVSCPCALVISIPLSFFVGIGVCSKNGILVKGSNFLEKLNQANIFVFDKTGTLTKGNFVVVKATPASRRDEILHLSSIAEQYSTHPIAHSILSAYGGKPEAGYTMTNIAGYGIETTNGKTTILCGNEKLMQENNITYTKEHECGTVVYVACDNEYIGSLLISDEIKDETKDVITNLNSMGCKTIMLTGDQENIAGAVAKTIGLTDYKALLLPQDKVYEVDTLLNQKSKNDVLCFVGDGINDSPVLMRSDIGIAMGGVGSDAAIEASDIVLMRDDLRGISKAKKIAKRTMNIVKQNIIFSIAIKVAILMLSALGFANMWIAVFGDVGVSILAILNAIRINKITKD